ncbi:uncharacterized protein LOC142988654 [Genypterus blacodes]|uniref:uncharacterized protein LOC142988654 n=1 Tax=Genypterus blacodes TaxID=154954 RepID=UPI003F769C7A
MALESRSTEPEPWPYLATFVTLKYSTDKTHTFECNLCKPKMKTLSTSKTSNTNLKTHIQRMHPAQMAELRGMLKQRKKLSTSSSEEGSWAAEGASSRSVCLFCQPPLLLSMKSEEASSPAVQTVLQRAGRTEMEPGEEEACRDQEPWPYLSRFMSLKYSTDKSYTFECNLCKPKVKTLSTSKTSSTNLRTHIQRMHPDKMLELRVMQLQKKKLSPCSSEDASWAAVQMEADMSGSSRSVCLFCQPPLLPSMKSEEASPPAVQTVLQRAGSSRSEMEPGEEDACRDQEPWPYLSRFMSLKYSTDKSYTFECNLCKPKVKTLSTSKSSNTNLKTHIQRMHPDTMLELRVMQLQKKKLSPCSSEDASWAAVQMEADMSGSSRSVCLFGQPTLLTTIKSEEASSPAVQTVLQRAGSSRTEMEPGEEEACRDQEPWPYLSRFMSLKYSTDKSYTFECNLCKPKVKTLSTSKWSNTNLRMHIQRIHPCRMEELRIMQQRKRKLSSSSSEEASGISRPFHLMRDGTSVSQAKFDRLILNFVIEGLHPLRVVERPEFQELFREVLPSKQLMTRKTLVRLLEEEFTSMKANLCRTLSEQGLLATTTDAWCVDQKNYLGVTAHWIDPVTLTVSSGALACRRIKESHTADVLARTLESIHRDFGIQGKVILTTTDNCSNFMKGFSVFAAEQEDREEVELDFTNANVLLSETENEDDYHLPAFSVYESEEEEGEEDEEEDVEEQVEFADLTSILGEIQNEDGYHLPPHQRCACHTLHYVATEDAEGAATDAAFRKISRTTLIKCQNLWNKQSKSTQATAIIKDSFGCKLVLPNVTGWNSTYKAMECLKGCIEVKTKHLHDVCDRLDLPQLKPAEMTFIKEYVMVMGPVSKALDVLQSDNMKYLGILAPTVAVLLDNLQRLKHSGLQTCAPLVDSILRGVETRFSYLCGKKYLMATALHPMFRLAYIPHEQRDDIISSLKQELQELPDSSFPDAANPVEEEEVNVGGDAVTAYFSRRQVRIMDEVDSFLLSSATSPVTAFQNLPKMKRLFIKHNTGIPAGPACERLFSVGKDIFLPKRSCLSNNNFEKVLMCRLNKSFCFTSLSET